MTNTDRLAQALLPCPFCGMAPEFKSSTDRNVIGVVCPEDSPCRGTALFVCFDSRKRDEAIEAWNRRAALASLTPAAVTDLIDEVDDITCHRPAFKDELRNALRQVAALTAQCEGLRKDAELLALGNRKLLRENAELRLAIAAGNGEGV
jgi:hypothetical protein